MARVKRGVTTHARHKKVLNLAKGYRGRGSTAYRVAIEKVEKALRYAYRDRRNRKRDFRALWIQRINAGAREHGLTYSQFMHERPQEADALLKDLLISVTNFFRDSGAFEALARQIIPRLFEGKTADDQVRVWVAGCATGEEAYTLAMMLSDHSVRLSSPGALYR